MKEFEEFLKGMKISEHSKATLKLLMKKKEKENKYQSLLDWVGFSTLGVILVFGLYFYVASRDGVGVTVLSFILNDVILLTILALLASLLYAMFYLKRKFDKAEKDVDKIRDDILDRSPDFWKTKEELQERYKIFKYLKEKQDINLFHK